MMKQLLSRIALVAIFVAIAISAHAAPPLAEVHSHAEIAKHFDRNAKVRILNVWATWCVPCVAEMPVLQAIHADYSRRGVSLVAVSMDDALPGDHDEARNRVAKFVESRSISFPSVLYVGMVPAIQNELRLSGEIPVTIVFDANGTELARIEGVLDATKFRAELNRLLVAKKPSTR